MTKAFITHVFGSETCSKVSWVGGCLVKLCYFSCLCVVQNVFNFYFGFVGCLLGHVILLHTKSNLFRDLFSSLFLFVTSLGYPNCVLVNWSSSESFSNKRSNNWQFRSWMLSNVERANIQRISGGYVMFWILFVFFYWKRLLHKRLYSCTIERIT